MNRLAIAVLLLVLSPARAGVPECDADNGGLTLPEGFCALVVADGIGRARHIVARDNGDIYVAIRGRRGGVKALRDTDGDGRADRFREFGDAGGTGIDLRDGSLYFATDSDVLRYDFAGDELVPGKRPRVVATGFPEQRQHAAKPFAFDDDGGMYVNVGAPSNACQQQSRTPGSPGLDPCPQLERTGGVWRFDADGTDQQQVRDGARFATGIRHAVAIDYRTETGDLYVVQHGRDQLSELWPGLYTTEQRAELPAEEMFRVGEGDDFGWPYCYYDPAEDVKRLGPEYGGDGETVGRCATTGQPVAAFPAHWAPNDLLFYDGKQFPPAYRGGAFVAFHGSWNRAPLGQAGYNVTFVPFDGPMAGEWRVFAEGFAGAARIETPGEAVFRPMGLATMADGSLLIADSVQGRIWRVFYNAK